MNLKLLSSLEKVFPCKEPQAGPAAATCLNGELFSFQVAVLSDDPENRFLPVHMESPLAEKASLYAVKYIPTTQAVYPNRNDEYYLSKEPGLFPDLLMPLTDTFQVLCGQWRSLWVEVQADCVAGEYPVTLTIGDASVTLTLTVLAAKLPKQELLYTQWFHCDCLATYYKVDVFSQAHWALIDAYMANAAKYGMNMILTPVLTPPLDTEIGSERPTVQLADITVTEEGYAFGFTRLNRYIAMAQSHGITHFEISHPFTQWGAGFAPKVMAEKDGTLQRIFGWETSATSPEYTAFIRALIIALKLHLKELGVFENSYFHISDEPHDNDFDSYYAAMKTVEDLYEDCHVCDALSNYSFYEKGYVKGPIPATDHIEPFLENHVPNLWTYYCCGQCVNVSNRFLAQPSAQNRIIGHQLYKFDIVGFLHWGYNFWYSQNSRREIDPFLVTDGDEAFPGGDPFTVYPGKDGQPLVSIRQLVFNEALQDLRAMKLLETCMPKDEILKLIATVNPMNITFSDYPRNPEFLLAARELINQKLAQLL